MRHLLQLLVDVLGLRRCPFGCGERVRHKALSRHWHLDHCGDPWSSR